MRLSLTQLSAARVSRYLLPRLASVPCSTAWALLRSQTSCASSGVSASSPFRCIWSSVSLTFCLGSRFRKGDCSRSISSAWLRVWSRAASPVSLVKSASTTSLSGAEWGKCLHPYVAASASRAPPSADTPTHRQTLLWRDVVPALNNAVSCDASWPDGTSS